MSKESNFANEVKSARKSRSWTQAELADRASVASRTVVAVEKGERPQKAIIVRLSYALDADMRKWLKHFKYDATDEEIDGIIRDSGHLHFPGERDPEIYWTEFRNKLEKGQGSLMCVCFLSAPRSSSHPRIKEEIVKCVKQGLGLSMICAYPPIPSHVKSTKPHFQSKNCGFLHKSRLKSSTRVIKL